MTYSDRYHGLGRVTPHTERRDIGTYIEIIKDDRKETRERQGDEKARPQAKEEGDRMGMGMGERSALRAPNVNSRVWEVIFLGRN